MSSSSLGASGTAGVGVRAGGGLHLEAATQKKSSSAHQPLRTVRGSYCMIGSYKLIHSNHLIPQMRKLRFGEVKPQSHNDQQRASFDL